MFCLFLQNGDAADNRWVGHGCLLSTKSQLKMGVIADHTWLLTEGKMGLVSQQCVNCAREKIWGSNRLVSDCLMINLPEGLHIVTIGILCIMLFDFVYTAVKIKILATVAVVLCFWI